ncbi:hypothetical protein ACWE42_22615 [Sutcliffiella cohnii]|uniref:hypothetical protein n=1 Tax=Sutcliffiella TaxID=2837511 RepID=UPI0022DE8567|nr:MULTISPECIES: hypothetical protein [Sutcliffiella]MED4015849.1 hypothetical protein [Sutcliffiella cohnii]WBL15011.1 hypothetical protein O1A01_24620 [Sutcliffiella sp. NC1]
MLQGSGNTTFVGLGLINQNENFTKISHDRYEVYVNGDYVGQKPLLAASEDITSVNDFLHSHGYNNFVGHLDGDHYNIESNYRDDELKQALKIYLHTR